jgi:aryl-alcohol dehydrogenase-like predicted oxidoreductase
MPRLDQYVTLGRSGLRVSPLCLGAMTFGEEWRFGADEKVSRDMIDCYLDKGGNFIDTANSYTNGHSEEIIGRHLGQDRARRDRVVIATKFTSNLHPGDPNGGGGNRKSIISACEDSLRRLRTDYIDLYWQHWMDPFTPPEETMQTLDTLVRAGKVRYVGISDTPAWRVVEAQMTALCRGWVPLTALQIEYSLLERTVEAELLPMAQRMGLGVTPWGPLRSGVLSGKYSRTNTQPESPGRAVMVNPSLTEAAFRVLDVLVPLARSRNTTPARMALAWLVSRPGVSTPIIGARTVAQLEENIAALELTLEPHDVAALDKVSEPAKPFPVNFLGSLYSASFGGLTINGQHFAPNVLRPRAGQQPAGA